MHAIAISVTLALLVAGSGKGPPAAPKVWLGTFEPAVRHAVCADCTGPKFSPTEGAVRVLAPADQSEPASGDVVIASPRLGWIARGHVDAGRVALAWFNFDLRDSDDGVLVLPGDAQPHLVDPTKADVASIRQALLRNEVLAGVHHALDGLEIGALDLDNDGRADLAATYGCNAWADGQCQSHGQFFVIRVGAVWRELDR